MLSDNLPEQLFSQKHFIIIFVMFCWTCVSETEREGWDLWTNIWESFEGVSGVVVSRPLMVIGSARHRHGKKTLSRPSSTFRAKALKAHMTLYINNNMKSPFELLTYKKEMVAQLWTVLSPISTLCVVFPLLSSVISSVVAFLSISMHFIF